MTYLFTFHMASQGAAVSLVELGEYQKASDLLEKLVKVPLFGAACICYLEFLSF